MNKDLKLKLYAFTIDCVDPQALGQFYAALLGWETGSADGEYVWVYPPGTQQGEYPCIMLQQNPDYTPPVWPDEPQAQQQMAHLDIAVNDLDKAIRHALDCGAAVAGTQFSQDWNVMFDPAGHPFCLCPIQHIFPAEA